MLKTLAATVIIWGLAIVGEVAAADDGKVSTFKLENGLEIVVIPDRRLPVVTHMVLYRVGSVDDPVGLSGLAHYVEHMMFKSCNLVKTETFSQTISRLGAIDNATTNHDITYYFQRGLKSQLATFMQLEAERMEALVINHEDGETERDVVRQERTSNVDSDPIKILNEQMMATLYLNSSYGLPPLGWLHEIDHFTAARAQAFHRSHYGPNNAVVVVAGDVDRAHVQKLAQEIYAPLKANTNIRPRVVRQEVEPIAARRLELVDARMPRSAVFRYYHVPSYASAQPGIAEALDIIAVLLGNSGIGQLPNRITQIEKKAEAVGAKYFSDARQSGRLVVFALAGSGASVTDSEAAIDVALAEFLSSYITEERVAQAKAVLEAQLVYANDSQQSRALNIGSAVAAGQSVERIVSRAEKIASVDVQTVKDVARRYLVASRSVTGIVRPSSPKAAKGN